MPSSPRQETIDRRALLGSGLASLVGFLVVAILVVHQGLDATDQAVRAVVHGVRHPNLDGFMAAVSRLGGEPGQAALVVLASLALWRRYRRWALALPVVMAGAGILQSLAKWGFDRPRPNLDPWGFPSAHVLTLVVLLGYLASVALIARVPRRWCSAGLVACALAASTVAMSRLYLDAHWLSDVLGGSTAGLAYLAGVLWLIARAPSVWPLPFTGRPLPGEAAGGGLVAAAGTPSALVP